jgi:hypothetical protein
VFTTDIPLSIQLAMSEQIVLFRNFGLGYDNDGSVTGVPYSWYVITSTNLAQDATWSQEYAGNTTVVPILTLAGLYSLLYKIKITLSHSVGYNTTLVSVLQTRFFFYDGQQVYDSRTGT